MEAKNCLSKKENKNREISEWRGEMKEDKMWRKEDGDLSTRRS
jgi:hypothetical protein